MIRIIGHRCRQIHLTNFSFSHGKKAWFLSHINDPYVKKANQLGYRSRAAFKLIQILSKHKNILGKKIIDLGCAPGSWLQVVRQKNPDSLLIGVDLLNIKPIQQVKFYQTDARSKKLHAQILQSYGQFDTFLSDIAPNFSGDSFQTHEQIVQINKMCLSLCFQIGLPSSNLIMKTLHGDRQKYLYSFLKCFFQTVLREKPKSSRSHSEQFYYICLNSKIQFHRLQEKSSLISQFIQNCNLEEIFKAGKKVDHRKLLQIINNISFK